MHGAKLTSAILNHNQNCLFVLLPIVRTMKTKDEKVQEKSQQILMDTIRTKASFGQIIAVSSLPSQTGSHSSKLCIYRIRLQKLVYM